MAINMLEINLKVLKQIFAARKIPDLEQGYGCVDCRLELNFNLYQLEDISNNTPDNAACSLLRPKFEVFNVR